MSRPQSTDLISAFCHKHFNVLIKLSTIALLALIKSEGERLLKSPLFPKI